MVPAVGLELNVSIRGLLVEWSSLTLGWLLDADGHYNGHHIDIAGESW